MEGFSDEFAQSIERQARVERARLDNQRRAKAKVDLEEMRVKMKVALMNAASAGNLATKERFWGVEPAACEMLADELSRHFRDVKHAYGDGYRTEEGCNISLALRQRKKG